MTAADCGDHFQTAQHSWEQPTALIYFFLKYIFLQYLGLSVVPMQNKKVESF